MSFNQVNTSIPMTQYPSPAPIYEAGGEDQETEEMVLASPRLMPLCETEELPDDGFTLSVPKEGK